MLLDQILEELQLTHKNKPTGSNAGYISQLASSTTLERLDDEASNKYKSFLGMAFFGGADGADHWLELCGDQYERRNRIINRIDSDFSGDKSEADFALACDLLQDDFTSIDTEIILRATRYRDKFDEMRGSATYLDLTISNAAASIAQKASTLPPVTPTFTLDNGRISIPLTPPAPRDYVWQGRIVAGHAYALGGFGGVSKSQAALQFAASIAQGVPFGGIPTTKGAALLIFGEDEREEIARRIGAYASHKQLSASQRSDIEKNIRALGLVGEDTRLTAPIDRRLESTAFAGTIINAAVDLTEQCGEPVRLIVLDHAGLIHGGDFNAREDVSLTMRIINHIAHTTGAAVLLLAHSPKSAGASESSDSSAIAGSTAFVDQTRGAFILATMRQNEAKILGIPDNTRQQYVSMSTVKNNYGVTGEVSWFSRSSPPGWEVGVLVPVDLQPPIKNTPQNSSVAERVLQFIAQNPGQYSKTSLRDKRSGKTGELKASKPEVAAAIEDLLSTGEIVIRKPTTDEQKRFGLVQKTGGVLDIHSHNCGNN